MTTCSQTAWGSWQPSWWQETLIVVGLLGGCILLAAAILGVTIFLVRRYDT